MNDQKKLIRLKELKAKIGCTEATLDTYRDSHPFLYQTNFYYLERLNQELQDIENSYREMRNGNKRKFSRIAIQRAVHLDFSKKKYHGILENISLSGLFINGSFEQTKGDICKITIRTANGYSDSAIRSVGVITRKTDSGIGVEFIAMKTASYKALKSDISTHTTNPLILKDEIARRDFFCFSDNLVCNRIFISKRNKLKKILDLF